MEMHTTGACLTKRGIPEALSRVHEHRRKSYIGDEWMDAADSAAMTKDTLAQTKTANAFLITRGRSSLRMLNAALMEEDA